jgi:hypothetical protein
MKVTVRAQEAIWRIRNTGFRATIIAADGASVVATDKVDHYGRSAIIFILDITDTPRFWMAQTGLDIDPKTYTGECTTIQ